MQGAAWRLLRRFGAGLVIAALSGVMLAGGAAAQLAGGGLQPQGEPVQGSAILTLDQDRLFGGSAFGQALQARTAEATAALAAENLEIENRLEQEERDLTARRQTLSAEDFAPLADAFDAKVEGIRQAQDAKSRDITDKAEADRQRFLAAAFPVLGAMMSEAGAVAILPKSTVFMSLNAIDVTDEAIRRLDAVLGDGSAETVPTDPATDQPTDQPTDPASVPPPAAP